MGRLPVAAAPAFAAAAFLSAEGGFAPLAPAAAGGSAPPAGSALAIASALEMRVAAWSRSLASTASGTGLSAVILSPAATGQRCEADSPPLFDCVLDCVLDNWD